MLLFLLRQDGILYLRQVERYKSERERGGEREKDGEK